MNPLLNKENAMTVKAFAAAILAAAVCLASPARADDSVQRVSAVSVGASVITGSAIAWTAYEGSELVIKAVRASGDGVVLVLQGASGMVEASAQVTGEALHAASVGVGTSVQVVAESTGTALVASGMLLAFVPNELGRALLHHARYR